MLFLFGIRRRSQPDLVHSENRDTLPPDPSVQSNQIKKLMSIENRTSNIE
ncbi:hypothetical protein D1AOALGA4SA_2879 [Olavius algarvensis Delta 1 endosymbiont]|nr:hypothetical protein D1AOALGA4SA_2879 [Olavius algarvensis Delta 1 endosymbiont]